MKKAFQKLLAVFAAASVCSSMLLNVPSGTFPIRWSASAEEASDNAEGVAIDETNFPDANFRTYVKENFDTTADNILTESELKQVTKIDVTEKSISDLTGIAYFTELTYLNCYANNLTTLDIRNNMELTTLYCGNNNISSLDLSNNPKLQELYCFYNQLKELDVRQNPALLVIYCDNNQLTELDVRQNPKLRTLLCDNNNLTSLDISQNPELKWWVNCNNNRYSIDLIRGIFDLKTLPGNFDVSKASNWMNATVDGNTLTVTDPKTDVTYTYDLGNGKTATFTLHPASCTLTESMVEAIPVQSHTGSEVTPDVTIKCGDTTLQKDTDYTISYASNIEIGTAKVTITGMGFFTGEITVPFEIGVAIDATNYRNGFLYG